MENIILVYRNLWNTEKWSFIQNKFSFSFGTFGIVNEEDKAWRYRKDLKLRVTKMFLITKLIEVQILVNTLPVSKFKRAVVGSMVFGPAGALSGMISANEAKPKSKISVLVRIDDIELSSVVVPCNGLNEAMRIINTLAQMEKDYYAKNPDKLKVIESKKEKTIESSNLNYVFSEEVMKLKKMLDDGIIDDDEFKAAKKSLLDKMSE